MTSLVLSCVCFLIMFFAALAAFGFNLFSRSRLEEICQRRGRLTRFGHILRHHESAELAWQSIALLAAIAAFLSGAAWWGLSWADVQNLRYAAIAELLLLIVGLLFLGVVLPWSVARVAGESFIERTWRLTAALLAIVKPCIWLIGWVDTIMHRLAGRKEPENGDAASITEEILTVVDEGQREGVLELEARAMIHRVMELREADVAEIMVPRTDMTCIHVESSLEAAREKLLEAGHSRVPVYGESPDDIIGILYAKDLLNYLNNGDTEAELRDILRQPFYVPETTGIDNLLQMLRTERVHLAIVLDEYGGVAGLATMEDILEEIVGEIIDEFDDAEAEPFRNLGEGVTEVDARVHVDDVNKELNLEVPDDRDFDTIGGFAFTILGHVPEVGESFEHNEARFTVLDVDKRKIMRLKIEVDPNAAKEAQQPLQQDWASEN